MLPLTQSRFQTSLATGVEDRRAAQRLRYKVFVAEMGSDGPLVDHQERLEIDRFDGFAEQLLLRDRDLPADDQVVGVYRLMNVTQAKAAGGFSSENEYDLSPLLASGRRVLELGRSCIAPDYRGGSALLALWQALAKHVGRTRTEILFGVASFHGTNAEDLRPALTHLHHAHLAPLPLRVKSRAPALTSITQLDDQDRKTAIMQLPALVKAYLRLGGCVGDGAFVDQAFNTTDVCMILDIARMSPQQRKRFEGQAE